MKHVTVWLLMLTILFCGYLISLISRFRKNHTQKAKKLYGSIHTENFNPTKYIPYTVSFLPLLLIVCSMCSRLLTYTKFITNLHVIYIATVPNYACMPMLIIIMVTAEMCQYLVSPSSQSLNVSIFVYIFRCDQYRWIHQGTRPLNHPSGVTIYRKSSVIDADSDDRHGDKRFKRHEYWGVGQHYIIHYIGDDTVFQNFAHHNSKEKSRPFIRSAPHIKNKVNVSYQAKTDLS